MFTGIIEDVGRVVQCRSGVLKLETRLSGLKQGDSVSVNGVCLTVTKVLDSKRGMDVSFDFTPETLSRTNFADLRQASLVNLERALQFGDRFSGHFVSGHVEGTGRLLRRTEEGNSRVLTFTVDETLIRYVVPKGSVAIDGISLTVVDVTKNTFSVSIIPHTMANTNLQSRKRNDRVNIEPDILAKYVDHLLHQNNLRPLTEEALKEHGFLS